MSEILQCQSCGESNQLPDAKSSMFCSFCGTAIKKRVLPKSENETSRSQFQTKPKIVKGVLSLKNRGLTSIDELLNFYSDKELDKIKKLNLSHNRIQSLKGIERLKKWKKINLKNNNISMSQSDIKAINSIKFKTNVTKELFLQNNKIVDDSWESQIDFDDIMGTYWGEMKGDYSRDGGIDFYHDEDDNDVELSIFYTNKGKNVTGGSISKRHPKNMMERITRESESRKSENTTSKGGRCFIATAAMGSYDHPQVIELRHFRDEWILQKQWGNSFVNWYYHYGAIAAKKIENNVLLKKLSYWCIVKPLVFFSRIVK